MKKSLTFSKLILVLFLVSTLLVGCSTGGKDDNTYIINATFQSVEEDGFYVKVISDTSEELSNGETVYCYFNDEIEIDAHVTDGTLYIENIEISEGDELEISYLYHYLDIDKEPITVRVNDIDIKTVADEIHSIQEIEEDEETDKIENDTDDLVYREFEYGENFFVGEATIYKTDILNLVVSPIKIMILYNDELVEEIDFTNTDITIEIAKEGNYCFLAVDENGETTDITSIVNAEATGVEGSDVILLD